MQSEGGTPTGDDARMPARAVRTSLGVLRGLAARPLIAGDADVRGMVIVVGFTAIVLVLGWMWAWWPFNQSFDHKGGWEHAQDAQLARMFLDGAWSRAFAPADYAFFDVGGGYHLFEHYSPLPHLLIVPFIAFAPTGLEHAVLRLGGGVVSVAFLAAFTMFADRLGGRRMAVWVLLFAAINAELIFFGAFPSMHNISALFAVVGYWCYLGWRANGRRWAFIVALLSLAAAQLAWVAYASAVAPILLDIVLHDPAGSGRRRWLRLVVVALVPVAVFVAGFVHYQLIVPAVVSEIWMPSRTDLSSRTYFSLLATPAFYSQLFVDTARFAAPVGLIAAAVAVARLVSWLLRWAPPPDGDSRWRFDFIVGTFALTMFAFAFPKNTLDHEMTYFQWVIPGALIAAWVVAHRGVVLQSIAVGIAVLMAVVGVRSLLASNTTPAWEFQLGIGLGLATPPGAAVRVPVAGENFFPLILYYANRPLLMDVPPQFQSNLQPRFTVVSGVPAPEATAGQIMLPPVLGKVLQGGTGVIKMAIIDSLPERRPSLPAVNRAYDGGAWVLLGAGVTGSIDAWRLVEVSWTSVRPTSDPLVLEIGEFRPDGTVAPLTTVRLRGDTLTTSDVRQSQVFRDGYLVKSHGGRLVLRVLPATSGPYPSYVRDDGGAVEVPLR